LFLVVDGVYPGIKEPTEPTFFIFS